MSSKKITPERVVGKFSFTSQSAFLYVVLPAFIYAFFLFVSGQYFMKAHNQPVLERCALTSEFVGEKMDLFIGERMNEILNLSSGKLPVEIIGGKSDKRDWHSLTRNFLKTSIQYDELMICDTLGNTIVSNKTDHRGNAFSDEYSSTNHFGEEWFRACLVSGGPAGGAYVSDINYSDYNLRHADWGIDLAAPLKTPTSKLMGVLKLRLNWTASVAPLLSIGNVDTSARIMMFTKQGNLIAANMLFSELKLGKNKMRKAPDFSIKGKSYSEEQYHYSWMQSKGSDIFRGNGWYVLVLSPRYRIQDLMVDPDFLLWVVAPGFGLLLFILISWNVWNRKLRRQIRTVKNELALLNSGSKVKSEVAGSSEMLRIRKEINELSGYHSQLVNYLASTTQFENDLLPVRSPADELSKSMISLGTAHIQMHELAIQNHYIAKGIQEITNILYTNNRDQALRKFCSYLHRYIHVVAVACFFPVGSKLRLEASWGLVESDINPEQYNLLFECRDSKKMIELYDSNGSYLNVKSGLGNTKGMHLYIIPMIFAQRCDGVFEIASVKPLSDDAIKFLYQAGSMLAVYRQYLIQEVDQAVGLMQPNDLLK